MASTLRDVAEQMAAVGIFIPEGHELKPTAPGFGRFRPVGQKSKKASAWYRIHRYA